LSWDQIYPPLLRLSLLLQSHRSCLDKNVSSIATSPVEVGDDPSRHVTACFPVPLEGSFEPEVLNPETQVLAEDNDSYTTNKDSWRPRVVTFLWHQTMDYDPFIKSQLASRNELSGLMWREISHVTLEISRQQNFEVLWVVSQVLAEDNDSYKPNKESWRPALPLLVRPSTTQWTSKVMLPRSFVGNVTNFAPHKARESISSGKLTSDERVVVHRVVPQERAQTRLCL